MTAGESEVGMRNGMSVKEIYEALDERDRLKNALQKELESNAKLIGAINKALNYIDKCADDYKTIAYTPNITKADKIEFLGKSSGLVEAWLIIKRYYTGSYEKGE